jgi:dihydrofolate synthase/folylpolyglutamate synthase
MLAAALQAIGLKTGLYTSPHILAFNERIRINASPVSDEALLEGLSRLMPPAIRIGASYFETATALALDQFAMAAVDAEILEAGVGARLDATTAVAADMALITPIGLDHQAWLGDALKEIAGDKAYAMKGCSWSISVEQHEDVAGALHAFNPAMKIMKPEPDQWRGLSAPGLHQRLNAALAFSAVQLLDDAKVIPHRPGLARSAIQACKIPGRLQQVRLADANIWLDAAHNRHAIEALLPSLAALADPFDAILVLTRKDRSLLDSLTLLRPFCKRLISNEDSHPGIESTRAAALLQRELDRSPEGSFLVLGSFTTIAAILRTTFPVDY